MQFAAHRADARAAENFTGLRVRQQFHKTILRLHDERFAVVIEWIACRQERNVMPFCFLLRQTDKRDLRFGEHD